MSDNHPETLLGAVEELNNWLVCWPIATPDDMAQNFPYMQGVAEWAVQQVAKPIDMVLHCPACGQQHIDAPRLAGDADAPPHPTEGMSHEEAQPFIDALADYEASWTNPPHRSHLCHHCGHIWRPADVPTNGVAQIKTRGKNDSEIMS